jgi:hypothetical protein
MRPATATSVMKPTVLFMVVLFMVVAVALSAPSQEKRITRDELPVAVRKTSDDQAKGATVRGYTKEVENGQVEFEVQLLTGGNPKDVSIAPDGRLLEIEEQVEFSSLPEEAKSDLQAAAKSGKITKVESIWKNGNPSCIRREGCYRRQALGSRGRLNHEVEHAGRGKGNGKAVVDCRLILRSAFLLQG